MAPLPMHTEVPPLDYALARQAAERLTAANIDFCVFSGSHAALLGRHRTTTDIDIWADNARSDALVAAFPDGVIHDRRATWEPGQPYDGVLVTLGDHDEIGIMAGTIIYAAGVTYPSPFTELVRSHRRYEQIGGLETWFADPADTLLFKAISQRGADQGKHDIDDIVAIHAAAPINTEYLQHRIVECAAVDRVTPLLVALGVLSAAEGIRLRDANQQTAPG